MKCCLKPLAALGGVTAAYIAGKVIYRVGSATASKLFASKKRTPAILITGACGEMGHSLVVALQKAYPGIAVVTMDLQPLPVEMKPYVCQHIIGSVCDKEVWNQVHDRYVCLKIFHLASLLSSSGERDPLLAANVNINGFLNAVDFALKQKEQYGKEYTFTPQLIFTSSIAAYGVPTVEEKNKAGDLKEDQYLHPVTMYGITKLQCEQLGRYFEQNFHMLPDGPKIGMIDFRCIRFPGLISAFTVPSGGTSDYGPEMLHNAAQGKYYKTFVMPSTRIPFMTMDDAVTSLIMLSSAPKSKLVHPVYNVSAFAPTAQEICNEVKKHFPEAKIEFAKESCPRATILDSWPAGMDPTAAREDWGFNPKHSTMAIAFNDYLLPHVKARYNVA